MENIFIVLALISLGGLGFSGFQFLRNLLNKSNPSSTNIKRMGLSCGAALIISVVGVGLTTTSATKESAATEITQSSAEIKTEKEAEKKRLAKIEAQKKSVAETTKKTNEQLALLEYDGTQTIDVNEGKPIFSPIDLDTSQGAWEKYGDLDHLNRATSAEALLHQSLMPTEKRGDISHVEPTGWQNKKLGNSYLFHRSHLIGYALSGENDNWKNLITGTQQLNNPEMLRYEMDLKTYLEKNEDHYVRYSVTPIFRDNELLARGVHLMAQSVDSDEIQFNVYVFNIQDKVTLNYADGSSETEEEILAAKAAKEQAEKEKAEQERIAAEQAEAARIAEEQRIAQEAEQQRIAAEQAEQERIAAEQAAAQQAADIPTEQTVFIAPSSGKKYHSHAGCRGLNNANSIEEVSIHQIGSRTPCKICY